METFEYGDRVTHQLHGTGKVGNYYPESKLIVVYFYADPESKRYGTLVHPVSLTKVTKTA